MIYLYFLFAFILLLIGLDFLYKNRYVTLIFLILIGTSLVFFATFRQNTRDLNEYYEIYNFAPAPFDFDSYGDLHGEPLYIFFNSIFKFLGLPFRVLLFVIAFLSVYLTFRFFYKFSDYPLVAAMLYFSHNFLLRDMMQIRSGLVASMMLYLVVYLEQNNWFRILLLFIIASLIHSTAIVYILPILAFYIFKSDKLILANLIIAFLLSTYIDFNLLSSLNESLDVKFLSTYLFNDEYNYDLGKFNPVLIKNVLIVIFVFLVFSKHLKLKERFYYVSHFVGVVWGILFSFFAIMAGRIANYFTNYEPLLITNLFLSSKRGSLKMLLFLGIIFYCLVLLIFKKQDFEWFKLGVEVKSII